MRIEKPGFGIRDSRWHLAVADRSCEHRLFIPETRIPNPGSPRMKATGTYQEVRDVDPLVELSTHTRQHIDHWVAKFSAGAQALGADPGPDRRAGAERRLSDRRAHDRGCEVSRSSRRSRLRSISVSRRSGPTRSRASTRCSRRARSGRNNVAICTNISCWLNGAEDIVRHCEKKLGVKVGESTPDGRIFLKPKRNASRRAAARR